MDDLKPMIRGVLLVSGQRVTEHEFCRAFYNTEGRSFQEIVRKNGKNFFDFMRSMPDTCKVMRIGDEVIVQKVSSEATVHIDMLKCSERTKRKKKPAKFKRFVPNFGNSMPYHPTNKPFRPRSTSSQPNLVWNPKLNSHTSPGNISKPSLNSSKPFNHSSLKTPLRVPNQQSNATASRTFQKQQVSKPPTNVTAKKSLPPLPHTLMTKIVYKPAEDIVEIVEKTEVGEPALRILQQYQAPQQQTSAPSNASLPPLPQLLAFQTVILPQEDMDEESEKVEQAINFEEFIPETVDANSKEEMVLVVSSEDEDESSIVEIESSSSSSSDEAEQTFYSMRYTPLMKYLQREVIELKRDQTYVDLQRKINPNIVDPVIFTKTNFIRRSPVKSVHSSSSDDDSSPITIENFITTPHQIPYPKCKEIKFRMLFEVQLLEIVSPSKFIFLYNHAEATRIKEELNLFYAEHKDDENLFINKPKAKMTVAAFDEKAWHRAEVLCVSGSHVMALFVDLGYTKYLKKNSLRFLEETFATPSRKACKGLLYGVKPINDGFIWKKRTVDAFKLLIVGKTIFASVRDHDENTLSLTLVDTSTGNRDIAEYLIQEDLAAKEVLGSVKPHAILM